MAFFVGVGGPFRAYSNNGINWIESIPGGFQAEYVTFGNGQFVAVGYALVGITLTSFIYTSPDGITWTSRTPSEAMWFQDISYANGLYVAVATDGTNKIMTSPDGITWTSRTTAITPSLLA
jgi:hypothetical protein